MIETFLAEYMDNILTVIVAVVGAWGVVYRANRQSKQERRSHEIDIADAEIVDRGKFRTDLMKQLSEMRQLLSQCKEEHQEAHQELMMLKQENQELRAEVSRLKLRLDQIEQNREAEHD